MEKARKLRGGGVMKILDYFIRAQARMKIADEDIVAARYFETLRAYKPARAAELLRILEREAVIPFEDGDDLPPSMADIVRP